MNGKITSKIIRRMIDLGYANDAIISRIRCTEEAVDAIRELIRIEQLKKPIIEEDDYDWDNE